jgi:hypothetical protein
LGDCGHASYIPAVGSPLGAASRVHSAREAHSEDRLTIVRRTINPPPMKFAKVLIIPALSLILCCSALAGESVKPETLPEGQHMYVIERVIPGAGKLTSAELKGIAQTSCGVLKEMGPKIQWLQSYVTGDKIFCVYLAPNEEMIREHAKKGGFPANAVSEVSTIISPKTAE